MKLYDPTCAGSYVWPMVHKNAKPGDSTSFQLTREPSPKGWEERGWKLAAPHQLGWYDEEGFYHTYRAAVEGAFEEKYFRVLQGRDYERAKRKYQKEVIEKRYAAKVEVAA